MKRSFAPLDVRCPIYPLIDVRYPPRWGVADTRGLFFVGKVRVAALVLLRVRVGSGVGPPSWPRAGT